MSGFVHINNRTICTNCFDDNHDMCLVESKGFRCSCGCEHEDDECNRTEELEGYFDAVSAWRCQECGDLVSTDYGEMEEHLNSNHDIYLDDD